MIVGRLTFVSRSIGFFSFFLRRHQLLFADVPLLPRRWPGQTGSVNGVWAANAGVARNTASIAEKRMECFMTVLSGSLQNGVLRWGPYSLQA